MNINARNRAAALTCWSGWVDPQPLTGGIYWMNMPKDQFPFLSLVEHTNFIEPSRYGGDHLIYCGDYLDPAELITAVSAVMWTADDLEAVARGRLARDELARILHGRIVCKRRRSDSPRRERSERSDSSLKHHDCLDPIRTLIGGKPAKGTTGGMRDKDRRPNLVEELRSAARPEELLLDQVLRHAVLARHQLIE